MGTIRAVQQGSPATLVSNSEVAYFNPVLSWPTGLVNTPVAVRGRGKISIPAGFAGYVGAGLAGKNGSNYPQLIGSFTSISEPCDVPFLFAASMYADPFLGSIIDMGCNPAKAKFPLPELPASVAVVGDQSNNQDNGGFGRALSFGSGRWNFDTTPVPLYVFVQLSATSGSIPNVTAQLSQFELEY